jgi:hypothetical protein
VFEHWLPVVGYEGFYEVSSSGQVKALARTDRFNKKWPERILSTWGNGGRGYRYKNVALCKNGKARKFQVHRLVAEAFIPNERGKPQVNHKDGDPSNNCVENLEWVTNGENNKHAYEKLGRVGGSKGMVGFMSPIGTTVAIDDVRYGSIADAVRRTGISDHYIKRALKKGGEYVRGKYVEPG